MPTCDCIGPPGRCPCLLRDPTLRFDQSPPRSSGLSSEQLLDTGKALGFTQAWMLITSLIAFDHPEALRAVMERLPKGYESFKESEQD